MFKPSLFLFLVMLSFTAFSQDSKVRPSPLALAKAQYKNTYMKIVYGAPQTKGRKIFGDLVPYGKVWRTGANEATELTITNAIQIGGQTVKAGTYSVFTIPNQDKWTLILNSDVGLWGAYNYQPEKDVLKVEAKVEKTTSPVDYFTIAIEQRNESAQLIFQWENVKVSYPVLFLN